MPSPRRMIFSHLKAEPHLMEGEKADETTADLAGAGIGRSALRLRSRWKSYTTADAQALIDADAFDGEMEQVDSYTVALLYGLEENAVIDCDSYIAINSSASADEVTVLVLRDEAAAKTAEEACKKRVESQIESYQTYGPDQVPRLEEAVISRRENTVLLAVGNPDRLPQALKDLALG